MPLLLPISTFERKNDKIIINTHTQKPMHTHTHTFIYIKHNIQFVLLLENFILKKSCYKIT